LVNFLLLIEDIPYYSKKDIDCGFTPLEIYRLCSSIKEAFCLSYSIRKQNNLFLFFYKTLSLIKFQGDKLRFLGSDERSQALLLNKAIIKLNEIKITHKWIKSTPGIIVKKLGDLQNGLQILKEINQNKIIIVNGHGENHQSLNHKEFINLKSLNQYLYILPIFLFCQFFTMNQKHLILSV
jgi:tRNA pseudouridine-54 N-methylase